MSNQNFSVLIADDNELNSWLLTEQLSQWTDDVTVAKHGKQAWQLLQNRKYSLILLDLHMPFLSGLELIKKVRSSDSINLHTISIAISAENADVRHALLTAGYNDCLFKPILLENLRRILQQWLGLAGADLPAYYAAQISQKTLFKRELAEKLLNSLFTEVPENLADIQQTLQQRDYLQAWQFAHKLQGSLGFYGFLDFLPMLESLQEHLLVQEENMANITLHALQTRFARVEQHKDHILHLVASED
ncbi:response regulator [Methylomonas paludis]|uniref:Response regulator n=1 Tax=Methylomonas paludis TaxID=1173101 RepID=A0A975R949_9GAMM|nr:response regulator [Methylomonas paludis]QWF71060.1 response regulator [Methylomonas paludis]